MANVIGLHNEDVENDKFSLPPWEKLMRYRVIVTSCMDAGILVTAQCTNASLASLEKYVLGTLRPSRVQPTLPHWTHLIIDEVPYFHVECTDESRMSDYKLEYRLRKDLNPNFLFPSLSFWSKHQQATRLPRPHCHHAPQNPSSDNRILTDCLVAPSSFFVEIRTSVST
jgi:hypothetical protein